MKTITLEVSDDIAQRFEATGAAGKDHIARQIAEYLESPSSSRHSKFLASVAAIDDEAARNGVSQAEMQAMYEDLCDEG